MDSSKSPFDDPALPGSGEPSSATGIFGTVKQSPPSTDQDDLLQSLLRGDTATNYTEETAAIAKPASTPVAALSSSPTPGSFTQMFQALQSSDAPSTPAPENIAQAATPPPAPPAAKPAADLTSVFTPVSIHKPAAPFPSPAVAAPPVAEQKAGEFTQLLKTLNNPVLKVESPAAETAKPSTEPGSFTQLFKTATQAHISQPPPEPASPAPAPTPVSGSSAGSGAGAFTQMFQTLSSGEESSPIAPATPSQPAAATGFTQMFQSLSGTKETAAQPPVTPAAFEPATSAPKPGPGAFTQMFSQIGAQNAPQQDPLASLKQEPPPPANFQFSPATPAADANPFRNTQPAPPAQGGFTQLFQALGNEDAAPPKEPPPFMPPVAATPAPPAAGGFTQLLRTLNTEAAPPQPQSVTPQPLPPAPPAPLPSSGPGEFTRIISGSMLREAQGQNVPPGSPPVMPAQQGGAQPAAFQMPQPPAFPKIPTAPPPMPQMHVGGGSAPQMPHLQPTAFAFPPAPAPPAPQPAQSKLQQYLPLILVVNVFVLIVVILIVVFALRHH